MLARARQEVERDRWMHGDLTALPFEDGSFDVVTVGFGVQNVPELEDGLRELRVLRPDGRLGCLEITQPRGVTATVLQPLVRSRRAAAHASCRAGRPTYLRACAAWNPPSSAPHGRAGFADVSWRLMAGGIVALPCREEAHVSASRKSRASPGLGTYLDVLELRLEQAVMSHPGLVSQVGTETLAAGGKRLRPVLVFLATPPDLATTSVRSPPASVELVHGDARPRRSPGRGGARARPPDGLGDPARRRHGRAATTSSPARSLGVAGSATWPPSRRSRARHSRSREARRSSALRPSGPTRPSRTTSALLPEDGSSSRPPVGSAAARSTWAPSTGAGSGVPDRGRHPRLRRNDGRDRQGARRRPPRRDSHRCRSSSPRARTPQSPGRHG